MSPVTPAMPSTFTPPTVKPDLRENKTSLDLEKATVSSFSTGSAGTGSGANKSAKKKQWAMIGGIVAFLILIVGGGVGLYLSGQSQETRQQASGGNAGQVCGSACTVSTDCPSGDTCSSAGKCVLTACLASGATCDATKCTLGGSASAAACSLSFNVAAPVTTSSSCQKVAYQDELSNSAGNYTLTTQKSTFSPGDTVVFKITVTNNGTGTGTAQLSDLLADSAASNLGKVTFLDSDCGAAAYDATKKTLTCSTVGIAPGASTTHIFRVKLASSIANGTVITNTCQAGIQATRTTCSTNTDCGSGQTCYQPPMSQCPNGLLCAQAMPPAYCVSTCQAPITVTTTVATTYTCGSSCTTDAQCKTANAGYVCDSNLGNICRMDSNRGSVNCQPPTTTTYTCGSSCTTDAQCQTANASYVCDSNLGNICRMDSNRGSANCQPPAQTYACDSSCSTDAQCQSANQNYVCDSSTSHCRLNSNPTASNCQPTTPVVVTPAVGCNQTCSTNADCASINHICVQTGSGLKCRLANYVNSDTCSAPGTTSVGPITSTTTVANTPAQPQKPAALPSTGSTDTTIHFLLMGTGAVILGALGLLLL